MGELRGIARGDGLSPDFLGRLGWLVWAHGAAFLLVGVLVADLRGWAALALLDPVRSPDRFFGNGAVLDVPKNNWEVITAADLERAEPAVKDGKPVPVLADLVVQFRIYSKRTAVVGEPEPADKAAAPALPGPYSVQTR